VQKNLLLFIYIVPFFSFNYGFVSINIIRSPRLIRGIPNGFYSKLTLIILPRVGNSILLFAQHFDREFFYGGRRDCSKNMINFFNIVLI
jgi:hypothetical protein